MPPLAAAAVVVQTAPMSRCPKTASAALATVLLLALAGCGFHLRNALLLPADLGPVQVDARDPHSDLATDLELALRRAGAEVVPMDAPSAEGEHAALRIVAERWGNTPISIDQFGRSQEFTLRYAVIFKLEDADGTALVPQQVIELARDYVSTPTQSIGTEGEREILAAEMRREMVSSILRRIDAVSRLAQEPAP